MSKKLITIVAGARPNFMKIAPVIRALSEARDFFSYRLVHTGQHYDEIMNGVFFEDLNIPAPDLILAGKRDEGDSEQTARIMIGFDGECRNFRPDLVMVFGDVNSTLACSIVAKKHGIRLAHVEAGLRSCDRSMPEEINRLITDAISDIFFVTEPSGVDSLLKEGHSQNSIYYVGHVMIDNLYYQLAKLQQADVTRFITKNIKDNVVNYGVVTLHRPSNVDSFETLKLIADAMTELSNKIPLIFPVHPRTMKNLSKFGISMGPNVNLIEPLPYMEFLNLWKDAKLVLTDSGGLQEETTALGIPCLTLRENTERPITIDQGSNILVGIKKEKILSEALKIISKVKKSYLKPDLWDGFSSQRILEHLKDDLFNTDHLRKGIT
jgi:UDP-N-acetylglucosamine 2-epimerase (non-hydrolysing)